MVQQCLELGLWMRGELQEKVVMSRLLFTGGKNYAASWKSV